jgi:hypothetical protein
MLGRIWVGMCWLSLVSCSDDVAGQSGPSVIAASLSDGDWATYWVGDANADSMSRGVVLDRTDHWWVALQVRPADAAQIESGGKSYDLTDSEPAVRFLQNYRGICDPSAEVPRSCFILEDYTSGETDLRGTASLKVDDGVLALSFSLQWQGLTDRFEGPPVWHSRVTEGAHVAELAR